MKIPLKNLVPFIDDYGYLCETVAFQDIDYGKLSHFLKLLGYETRRPDPCSIQITKPGGKTGFTIDPNTWITFRTDMHGEFHIDCVSIERLLMLSRLEGNDKLLSKVRYFEHCADDGVTLTNAVSAYPDSKEIRSVSSTGAEKGVKPERFDLIPVEALTQVARLYGRGAEKYAEHNWRKGYEWSKSYAALQRHLNLFWSGEDIDEEMGLPHLACAAFHTMTLLTFMEEKPEFDDRFKKE